MRTITIAIVATLALSQLAFGQATVNLFDGPPAPGWTKVQKYDTSNRIEYICYADPLDRPTITYTQGGTLTNIIDDGSNEATATITVDHGLTIGNTVAFANITTDTDLNGTYIVTSVPSTKTFTVTTASVTGATYTDAGTTVVSTSPRTAASIWVIQRFQYDSSGNLTSQQWARGSVSAKAFSSDRKMVCDDASSFVYE